jgi:glyoxylase-like metal-dependent hydrolase (beta-lactamase superfamily II)
MITIQAFPSGPFETNAYVVSCKKTHMASIVDPAPSSATAIVTYLHDKKLTPVAIWLTHSHWDHIADTATLKKRYQIPVYIHALDAKNLEMPGSDGLPCWITIEGVAPDHLLKEGDRLKVGEVEFTVIDTPGHTPGGVCFYSAKEGILLSGDTLFKGTIGNLSFPTARPKLMWSSLDKLASLPPATKVFPGHGPSTTIVEEGWLKDAKKLFGNE